MARLRSWLKTLGPGFITGVSDDDPSGIATYSQAGARFGFGLLWTLLLTYPLMCAIQEICATLGRVTGHGIAGNLRRHYSRKVLFPVVALLFVVNVVNLAADLAAMGAAANLMFGGSTRVYCLAFAAISLTLQISIPYRRYVEFLKWITLPVFAYVVAAFMVRIGWKQALAAAFLPRLHWDRDQLSMILAVFGTTISPYLFFWQSSQEVEEVICTPGEKRLKTAPEQAPEQLRRIRIDTWIGMACSNLIAFFIILTCATTLHLADVTEIRTAADAANALRPIAGNLCFYLFGVGIVGTGLLAVPVLAGSAAYGIGETFRWRIGLERKPGRARAFYGVIALSVILSLAIDFSHVDPIRALIWAAILNGFLAAPLMTLLLFISSNEAIMGKFVLRGPLKLLGSLAALLMTVAAIGSLFPLGKGM